MGRVLFMISSRHLQSSAIIAILSAGCLAAAIDKPVKVEGGQVAGVVSTRNASVISFKGIPFAAPPVGDLRWRAPQKVVAWQGVKQADKFGASCFQRIVTESKPWTYEFMTHNEVSEDCLYLNLWTAAKAASEKRPVYVFLYGGGFNEGSGAVPAYDGDAMAQKGLVVVTINYRVGLFGYLAHPDLTKEARLSRFGELWSARSDRGTQMGSRQYRGIRRRSGEGDCRRAVRGWNVRALSHRIAARERFIYPRCD